MSQDSKRPDVEPMTRGVSEGRGASSVSARDFAADDRCRFRPSTVAGVRIVARLTARCIFLCEHCLASAAGNVRSSDRSLGDWQRILSGLRGIAAHKVLLTGGEPLLFDGLVELTAHIAEQGVSTDLNSTLWSMTPRLARRLAAAGLTEASISLEGPEEVHDRLHGRSGACARLKAGVRMLQDVGSIVDGSMCVTPMNLPHVASMIEEAARMGLASFTVSRMMPVGHGLSWVGPRVPQESLTALHADLASARAGGCGIPVRCVGLLGAPGPHECEQGRTLIGIRADGTLAACPLSRDDPRGVPKPEEVGLAAAVAAVGESLRALASPRMCYGLEDL